MTLISGFAKKLMLARELKMGEGRLEILHQRVIIMPIQFFTALIESSLNNKEFEKDIYKQLKLSVKAFCKKVDKKFRLRGKKLEETLVNLTELNGYGHIKIIKDDPKNKIAVLHLTDLPSIYLKGKLRGMGDVYWAGILAGGISYVYNADVDCIETKCILNGEPFCEFVAAEKRILREKFGVKYGKRYKKLLQ